ncbi:unnamed protein product [Linum trigynum]|uniref:Uncharacterized protein n=1 Tax=Linum trigynum TaxID=586398 RepID=A0AAV2DGI0_9ROSI
MEIHERHDLISISRRCGRHGKPLRDEQGAAPAVAMKHREKETSSRRPNPSSGTSPRAGAHEVTRRRRLILEEESEDDFSVQPISSIGQDGTQPPPLQPDPRNLKALQNFAHMTRLKG